MHSGGRTLKTCRPALLDAAAPLAAGHAEWAVWPGASISVASISVWTYRPDVGCPTTRWLAGLGRPEGRLWKRANRVAVRREGLVPSRRTRVPMPLPACGLLSGRWLAWHFRRAPLVLPRLAQCRRHCQGRQRGRMRGIAVLACACGPSVCDDSAASWQLPLAAGCRGTDFLCPTHTLFARTAGEAPPVRRLTKRRA